LKETIFSFVNMSSREREVIGRNGREWIYSNRKYSTLAQKYINVIEMKITNQNKQVY